MQIFQNGGGNAPSRVVTSYATGSSAMAIVRPAMAKNPPRAPPGPKTRAQEIVERLEARAQELNKPLKGRDGLLAAAGVSESYLQDLRSPRGKRRKKDPSPRADKLGAIAKAAGLTVGYLMEGSLPRLARAARGETPPENVLSVTHTLAIPEYVGFNSTGSEGTSVGERRYVELPAKIMLPLASNGSDNLSFIVNHDDAMEPALRNGDLLIVDRGSRDPALSAIYAIKPIDSKVVVPRRVRRIAGPGPGRLLITTHNKDIEPDRTVDGDQVEIVGRVVWFGRQV